MSKSLDDNNNNNNELWRGIYTKDEIKFYYAIINNKEDQTSTTDGNLRYYTMRNEKVASSSSSSTPFFSFSSNNNNNNNNSNSRFMVQAQELWNEFQQEMPCYYYENENEEEEDVKMTTVQPLLLWEEVADGFYRQATINDIMKDMEEHEQQQHELPQEEKEKEEEKKEEEQQQVFTKNEIKDYDCITNHSNRHTKFGQRRWYEMRKPRRDLTNHPNEALELMNQFQKEMKIYYNINNNNKRRITVVRPKLVFKKEDGSYIRANLEKIIKNVNSNRKKRKSTEEEPPLLSPSTEAAASSNTGDERIMMEEVPPTPPPTTTTNTEPLRFEQPPSSVADASSIAGDERMMMMMMMASSVPSPPPLETSTTTEPLRLICNRFLRWLEQLEQHGQKMAMMMMMMTDRTNTTNPSTTTASVSTNQYYYNYYNNGTTMSASPATNYLYYQEHYHDLRSYLDICKVLPIVDTTISHHTRRIQLQLYHSTLSNIRNMSQWLYTFYKNEQENFTKNKKGPSSSPPGGNGQQQQQQPPQQKEPPSDGTSGSSSSSSSSTKGGQSHPGWGINKNSNNNGTSGFSSSSMSYTQGTNLNDSSIQYNNNNNYKTDNWQATSSSSSSSSLLRSPSSSSSSSYSSSSSFEVITNKDYYHNKDEIRSDDDPLLSIVESSSSSSSRVVATTTTTTQEEEELLQDNSQEDKDDDDDDALTDKFQKLNMVKDHPQEKEETTKTTIKKEEDDDINFQSTTQKATITTPVASMKEEDDDDINFQSTTQKATITTPVASLSLSNDDPFQEAKELLQLLRADSSELDSFADAVLSLMRSERTKENEELQLYCMEQIKECLTSSSSSLTSILIQHQVHHDIFAIMIKFKTLKTIYRIGIDIIMSLMMQRKDDGSEMFYIECFQQIQQVTKGNTEVAIMFVTSHAPNLILYVMKRFMITSSVIRLGSFLLWRLCVDKYTRQAIVEAGACNQLHDLLVLYSESDIDIATNIIGTLGCLQLEQEGRKVLEKLKTSQTVAEVMVRHIKSKRIAKFGCIMLYRCVRVKDPKTITTESTVLEFNAVAKVMLEYQSSYEMMKATCLCLKTYIDKMSIFDVSFRMNPANDDVFGRLLATLTRESTNLPDAQSILEYIQGQQWVSLTEGDGKETKKVPPEPRLASSSQAQETKTGTLDREKAGPDLPDIIPTHLSPDGED